MDIDKSSLEHDESRPKAKAKTRTAELHAGHASIFFFGLRSIHACLCASHDEPASQTLLPL
jgi:hypothetical protein